MGDDRADTPNSFYGSVGTPGYSAPYTPADTPAATPGGVAGGAMPAVTCPYRIRRDHMLHLNIAHAGGCNSRTGQWVMEAVGKGYGRVGKAMEVVAERLGKAG